jgi:putative peptidoglycan lipid II flippase
VSRVSPGEVDDWGFDEIAIPAATAAGRRPAPPPEFVEPEPERPPDDEPAYEPGFDDAYEIEPPPPRTIQLTIEDLTAEELDYDETPAPLEPAIEEPGDEWAIAAQPVAERRSATHGVARNTAIFSILTGASRIMGLVREIVAAYFFGTTGRISAFTIAFQVPNLVRGLFADAALSAAFVPVFTGLLDQGKKREAHRLASALLTLIVFSLGLITLFFILAAGVIMPIFTGDKFSPELVNLTVGLSRVLFPIVLLLGVNGLVVGILNAQEHFTIPALAPLVWNLVIIFGLATLEPLITGINDIYAYAISIVIATAIQLMMSLPQLRRLGFRFEWSTDWRDPRIVQVLKLMVPVCIGLGVINFDLIINSSLGSLVSDQAPRAIDAAFRIYMLPQGMFSVAIATVLFPALSRYASRRDVDGMRATQANGVRQIFLLLIPSAAFMMVLAVPIVRLIYQHGEFNARSTHQVAQALFWFSFSLPFAGVNLLLTRTFFSVQRPWLPTGMAAANLVVNAALSIALYKPLGIAGLVIGTAVASLGMTLGQLWALRRDVLHGRIDGRQTLTTTAAVTIASALLGAVSWVVWAGVDQVFGRSVIGQILSVGSAAAVGGLVYAASVRWMGIEEYFQIERLVRRRLDR